MQRGIARRGDGGRFDVTAATPAALARLAWHLGDRYLPVEIREAALGIRDDHVIVAMLEGLGARVTRLGGPFRSAGLAVPADAPADAGRDVVAGLARRERRGDTVIRATLAKRSARLEARPVEASARSWQGGASGGVAMSPNDVPREPPSGRVFGKRVGGPAGPVASPPSPPAFAPSPVPARPPARAAIPAPDDEDAAAELDAELVRADAHVRSASVGLWLVVIVAAVCALGFVAASLLMQG